MIQEYKIGFANKFYTLWIMTTTSKYLGNGKSCIRTDYEFKKNISMTKEYVIKKYPGVEIDPELRGKSWSFSKERYEWTTFDEFRFGKYEGLKLDEIKDYNYTAWYFGEIRDDKHKEVVKEFLENAGYRISPNGCVTSPKELIELQEMKERAMEFIEMAENGELIEFVPETNLSFDGLYRQEMVLFKFPEVKEMYYNGYEYYLPVLNGKTKRIKNKTIMVTEYTYKIIENGGLVIYIEKFEIAKN